MAHRAGSVLTAIFELTHSAHSDDDASRVRNQYDVNWHLPVAFGCDWSLPAALSSNWGGEGYAGYEGLLKVSGAERTPANEQAQESQQTRPVTLAGQKILFGKLRLHENGRDSAIILP
jgi:hypothetical protein